MPLILRKAQGSRPGDWEPDDFDVKSGGFTVGRICKMQDILATPWFWTISGVFGHPGVMTGSGHAETREAAMQALATNWRKWIAWAALKEIE